MERKDLQNIERAFGLKAVQRHLNDQQSVLSWIEEWSTEEQNTILYYKLQGQEAEDEYDLANDLFIAVQTLFQKEMLLKFGHKGICYDSTHGTNAYDFNLTSLLVVAEFGQGFPVAWCL